MEPRRFRPTVVVAAALVTASLGTAAGFGLHRSLPGADPAPSAATSPPGIPVVTSSPSARPSPSPTATPTGTPATASPNPTGPTGTPTRTPQPGPAFTDQALLLPKEFTDRGWQTARVVQRFDELPEPSITPCAGPARGPDVVRVYAAIYTSNRTTADEVAVRYVDTRAARQAFATLRAAIEACAPTAGVRLVDVRTRHRAPDASRVSETLWWNTRDLDGGPMRGVLALGRADDRVVLLDLESDQSDPATTTRVDDLLIQAVRRLV